MKIKSHSFNRYVVNKKELVDIIFYTPNGVELTIDRGWLSNEGTDIKSIELPIDDVKTRKKVSFDKNEVFLYINTLYIPSEMVNLTYEGEKLEYETSVDEYMYDYYSADINAITCFGKELSSIKIIKQSHIIKKEFGLNVEKMYKELHDNLINITMYDLIRLMEKYEFVSK